MRNTTTEIIPYTEAELRAALSQITEDKQPEQQEYTTDIPLEALQALLDRNPKAEGFADQIEGNLKAFFASLPSKHNPTGKLWDGLQAIVYVYAAQVYGCFPNIATSYLSSVAPGVGKTSALLQCVKLHVETDDLKNVGAVIFLEQLHQIKKLADDISLPVDRFAVLSSDDDRNEQGLGLNTMGLGRDRATEAQILFTTQRRLEKLSKKGRLFRDIPEFYFNGQPRLGRFWDEAILPSAIFTLDEGQIDGICSELYAKRHFDLRNAIKAWKPLEQAEANGGIVTPPDIADFGITSDEQWLGLSDLHREDFRAYAELSGKNCRITVDPYSTNAVLRYVDILPSDLNVCILDASGDIRHTYRLWKEYRKNLLQLPNGQKLYNGVTFHLCNEPSGRLTQTKPDPKKKLVDHTLQALCALPNDRPTPLLISYKKEKRRQIDWKGELEDCSEQNWRNVDFTWYGRHTQTNAYAASKDIFIVGLNELPPAQYEGMYLSGKQADQDAAIQERIDKAELAELRIRELRHHHFQAVNRGAIRECHGDQCPEDIHVYVICKFRGQGAQVPGEGFFTETFPGCKVVDWPMDKELKGRTKEALDVILDGLAKDDLIGVPTVCKLMGMDKSNFDKDVLKNDGFKREMKARGIVIEGNGGRRGNRFKRA